MRDIDANIHFHGFEGPSSQDDVFVSALSTPEHACEYELTVPVTQPPGTYFYHPTRTAWPTTKSRAGSRHLDRRAEHAANCVKRRSRDRSALSRSFRPRQRLSTDIGALERAGGKNEATLPANAPVPFDPLNPPPWPTTVPVRGAQERLNACGSARASSLTSTAWIRRPNSRCIGSNAIARVLNANADSIVYLRMRDAAGNTIPLRIVGRDGIPVGATTHTRSRSFSH